ncbi:hypothetical protein C9I57_05295 [Trinickia symbiotica]|uniref:BrnA antitoxin family protein n=1 Tax=Trinickia symbiotica TaxID=863227 RepID=A0A2T3XZV0_9BURK|nr:BrnA antitoxin family protein [Trinickia symbiotica]PTB22025.1 hypothetical protein C9I57_05295 [Trinickia symbiotica]
MSKRKLIPPTPQEDAEINRGIASDPDTYEVSTEQIKRMRPFSEVIEQKRMGRPPKGNYPKELVSIRYDAQVLEYFRSEGNGWQTRMNDVLLDYVKAHPHR